MRSTSPFEISLGKDANAPSTHSTGVSIPFGKFLVNESRFGRSEGMSATTFERFGGRCPHHALARLDGRPGSDVKLRVALRRSEHEPREDALMQAEGSSRCSAISRPRHECLLPFN